MSKDRVLSPEEIELLKELRNKRGCSLGLLAKFMKISRANAARNLMELADSLDFPIDVEDESDDSSAGSDSSDSKVNEEASGELRFYDVHIRLPSFDVADVTGRGRKGQTSASEPEPRHLSDLDRYVAALRGIQTCYRRREITESRAFDISAVMNYSSGCV
jgi:hypothetical protein